MMILNQEEAQQVSENIRRAEILMTGFAARFYAAVRAGEISGSDLDKIEKGLQGTVFKKFDDTGLDERGQQLLKAVLDDTGTAENAACDEAGRKIAKMVNPK